MSILAIRRPRFVARGDAAKPRVRSPLLDNARAISILMIMMVHAPGLDGFVRPFSAFRMPMLFFAAGVVLSERHRSASVMRRLDQLVRKYVVPYIVFFAISLACWWLIELSGLRTRSATLPWWHPIVGLFTGTSRNLYVNVALWFFPCLFLVSATYYALRKSLGLVASLVVCMAASMAFCVLRSEYAARWIWSADCALVALPFYAIGASVHAYRDRLGGFFENRSVMLAALVALIFTSAICAWTDYVDLNLLQLGRFPILYVPLGVIGLFGVLLIASKIPRSAFATWIAENSIFIFSLHFPLFAIFTFVVAGVLRMRLSYETSWGIGLGYLFLALVLFVPISYGFRRYVPAWLYGQVAKPAGRPASGPG